MHLHKFYGRNILIAEKANVASFLNDNTYHNGSF